MSILLEQLLPLTDKKKKLWWENYVKHQSLFLGIPMAQLRNLMNEWTALVNFSMMSLENQKKHVLDFFSGAYAEEKLLGILLMSEHMKEVADTEILDLVELLMAKRYVSDWNICDWLCVKVLTPRLKTSKLSKRLLLWADESYLWHRRAALVPFCRVDFSLFSDEIFLIASKLITSEERFSKTAVGWVLREMMPNHRNDVLSFMIEYKLYLTTEVVNNILKHTSDKAEIKLSLK